MKRMNIKIEKTLTQSFQAQLATRKQRTLFFLSSGFPPSSEVSSAGQCQSCVTEFVNQELGEDNNFYVCCDLLYLCYSQYRFSIFYFSGFPCFWDLHYSFTYSVFSLHPLFCVLSCVFSFFFGDCFPSLWAYFSSSSVYLIACLLTLFIYFQVLLILSSKHGAE